MADSTLEAKALQHRRAQNAAVLAQQRSLLQWRYIALVAPAVIYLGVFYLYPVLAMLFRSIAEPEWTTEHYVRLVTTNVYAQVLWTTVTVALVVTILTLLLGYPLAYTMSSVRGTKASIMIMLVLVPFWTSILVRSYAWMVLLGRQGLINQFLLWLGLIDTPLRLLNTRFAVYVAMVHVLLPFMVLPIFSVMRGIDRNLIRAAQNLGATPSAVFRQVTFPLSMPGVAAGCLLVFILSIGFYITPALVGGERDVMIAVLIAQQVDLFNWPFASALAAVLLVSVLVAFVVFNRVLGVERIVRGVRA